MSCDKLETLFRIDLYPVEWLVKTAHMTPEQRGVFITVCCLIYSDRGAIEPDYKRIANMSNCSVRFAKSIVQNLVDKKDLKINSDGKIDQERCERELKKKRTHLENSAEGGRKRAENMSKSNENNVVSLSDHVASQPTLTLPLSPNLESIKPIPVLTAAKGGSGSLEMDEGRKWFFEPSDETYERLRSVAPGWDRQYLLNTYRDFSKGREKPNVPDAAFLGWAKKFTKGKPPA